MASSANFYISYSRSFPQPLRPPTVLIFVDHAGNCCWADNQTLGDDLPLTSREPLAHLYIGMFGTPDDPALVDNLVVSRTAPTGHRDPDLLPPSEDDLIFRFAATGDPQLGFTSIGTDKARFAHATDQINRSGAELSLMLGDMIHFNDDLNAYVSLAALLQDTEDQF